LAVVPARGGSKRLPGKNIKILDGLPLLAHALRTALASKVFWRVIVSTDEGATAEVARAHGGEVPWLRSAASSTDDSGSVDVVLEVVDRLAGDGSEPPDAVALLQPTSPFRAVETIRRAVDLFEHAGGESVVTVSPAGDHPWWCRTVTADGVLRPFLPDAPTGVRSQDLPPAHVLNGVLYLASVDTLRTRKSFESPQTRALVMESPEEALDIDTPFDWTIAEAVCRLRRGGSQ
jgi:CMP-N,N'-diacetyllegionaminic acid synthase